MGDSTSRQLADGGLDAEPDAEVPPCEPLADFGTPVLIPELSDAGVSDGTLRLLADERTGYFWRGDPPAQDIYFVSRSTFSAPFTISTVQGVNTTANELDPTLTTDGTLLVFRRNSPGDDIYAATLITPTLFSAPTAITTVNSTASDAQGFMPLGIDELYFQSKRTAAGDVYRATRAGTTFGAPVNVSELATSAEEGDPVVTPDGLTILLPQRSHRGGRRLQHLHGHASDNGRDVRPPLVPNVNTSADDGPSWISPDGCRLYISGNVRGNNDIYVATRGR